MKQLVLVPVSMEAQVNNVVDAEMARISADLVEAQLQASEAQLTEARQLLARYGRHHEGCPGAVGWPCKCGWALVYKRLMLASFEPPVAVCT